MALKNLLVVDSNLGSHSDNAEQDCSRRGSSRKTSSEAHFDEADEQPHRPLQPGWFPNDDDHQIALVPRGNRTPRTGLIREPSTTMRHVFLLPITWQELLDRVRREPNQLSTVEQSMITRFGEVRVNFQTMEIRRSEKPVVLTAKEFKLLRFFTQTPKRVFSRNELLNEVWGYNNYPSTRTVDSHIFMLRQKLELNPARPIHFLTVHRMGYKFVP
jgi:DNA-binding winged helix-turn-helix (wHTH) protein